MAYRVTGTGLLSLVRDVGTDDRSKLITMAGYVRPDGKLAYTAFYEALIEAQNGEPKAVTYDDSDYSKEWCQCIAETLHDVDEIDARDTVAEELADLGIETEEQLADRYYGCFSTWNFYREFGEEFIESYGVNIPDIIQGCIDYEALWDSALRFDFDTFEFGRNTYVFRNC